MPLPLLLDVFALLFGTMAGSPLDPLDPLSASIREGELGHGRLGQILKATVAMAVMYWKFAAPDRGQDQPAVEPLEGTLTT